MINIQTKSEVTKAKWIIDIATNLEYKTNLNIFTALVGTQVGNISGRDLVFLPSSYYQHRLKTDSKFYKEAFLALGKYVINKGVSNVNQWSEEHIFYNPLFTYENGVTLSLTKYCKDNKIYRYGQLLTEVQKELRKEPYQKLLTNFFRKIKINPGAKQEDTLTTHEGKEVKLNGITSKQLYEETPLAIGRLHHSQIKWVERLKIPINWDEVWISVYNILSTNQTRSIIWEQIHLNFYTQYSYNKWHKKIEPCPYVSKIHRMIFM